MEVPLLPLGNGSLITSITFFQILKGQGKNTNMSQKHFQDKQNRHPVREAFKKNYEIFHNLGIEMQQCQIQYLKKSTFSKLDQFLRP